MATVLNEMLIQPQSLGEVFLSARDVSGPASYTTGGVTLSPQLFALLSFKILLTSMESPDGTYFARFVAPAGSTFGTSTATAAKMVWFVVSTGAEVAAAVNLSTEKIRVLAIGN
jgi:hypothetical protein